MKLSPFILVTVLVTSVFAIATAPLMAQSQPPATMGNMKMEPNGDNGPSSKAFMISMEKMQKNMNIAYTGNTDVDFVKGMMPHHQGAIDMAKVELQYGKNPEMRKLAQGIVKAQEQEIAEMKAWLAKKGK